MLFAGFCRFIRHAQLARDPFSTPLDKFVDQAPHIRHNPADDEESKELARVPDAKLQANMSLAAAFQPGILNLPRNSIEDLGRIE